MAADRGLVSHAVRRARKAPPPQAPNCKSMSGQEFNARSKKLCVRHWDEKVS
jgi:hypothetical protein